MRPGGLDFERKPPMFPITLWSTHDRAFEGDMLTTNNAELFHRKFRHNIVQGTHPSMLAFIAHLQTQQSLTNNDLTKIEMGDVHKETKECKKRNARIQELLRRRRTEEIDVAQLLEGIATVYLASNDM